MQHNGLISSQHPLSNLHDLPCIFTSPSHVNTCITRDSYMDISHTLSDLHNRCISSPHFGCLQLTHKENTCSYHSCYQKKKMLVHPTIAMLSKELLQAKTNFQPQQHEGSKLKLCTSNFFFLLQYNFKHQPNKLPMN